MGSIRGRHTLAGALLKFRMLTDVGFCVLFVFRFIQSNKSMQRSGTEAIRTQIQPSKPKREIVKIQIVKIQREHTANRVSSYLPKGGHSVIKLLNYGAMWHAVSKKRI